MSCAAIMMQIAAKESDIAKTQAALKAHQEHQGYLLSVFEQELYELNIKLQLAEADKFAEDQAASLEAKEDPCYHCGRAIHSCLCPEQQEQEPEQEPVPVPHAEGTKLKWVLDPETYRVAIVKKKGILEVKRVTDGGGHCHDYHICTCMPCGEIDLSQRLGVPNPPWRLRAPLTKTFFATEAEWRASLPEGGSVNATPPSISARKLKTLSCTPLTGTTDGLKIKELEERFPGATLVLTTAKEQLEIEHVYYDMPNYPEAWRHQIYSKKLERSVFYFTDLGESANGKTQLMAEWKGLYIDLTHLF